MTGLEPRAYNIDYQYFNFSLVRVLNYFGEYYFPRNVNNNKLTSTSTPLWFLVQNQRGVYLLRSSFQKQFQKSCSKVVFSGHAL